MRRVATILVLLTASLPAVAADLSGKIVFEAKPGCDKIENDLLIRTSGSTAEILIGNRSRGFIPIDPKTGNFLSKQTDNRLIIAGSITNGALQSGYKQVEGGCIGRFKMADEN